jgi:hypothetical protein
MKRLPWPGALWICIVPPSNGCDGFADSRLLESFIDFEPVPLPHIYEAIGVQCSLISAGNRNMDTLAGIVCSACHASVLPSANFCPNCGHPLRTTPPATSVSRQIIVYLISFFLAPFGLWYAWKYLKQDDRKSKMIGAASIALTIAAVAIAIWTTAELFSSIGQYLNSLRSLGL